MGFFSNIAQGLRGGAQAGEAVKIIAKLTGEMPSEFAMQGLKDQGARGTWRNSSELALLHLRGECDDLLLGGKVIKHVNPAIKARVLSYYEACRAQGLLGDYMIDEYEQIKQKC